MKSVKVGIINLDLSGNIFNVYKAVEQAGGKPGLIKKSNEIKLYDKIILPGVGSFPNAMKSLKTNDFYIYLKDAIIKKPTLGICIGLQVLGKVGYEFKETKGLGLIDAEVRLINTNFSLPNMGFRSVEQVKKSVLFKNIENLESFYFMHSYEFINYKNMNAITNYGNHSYVCSIEKENIFGVQFHPEKSRASGIKLIENFLNY